MAFFVVVFVQIIVPAGNGLVSVVENALKNKAGHLAMRPGHVRCSRASEVMGGEMADTEMATADKRMGKRRF